jgi:hypothetical protein
MTRQPPFKVIIDLGNGVKLAAPFKKRWTLAEWRRMTAYVESCVGAPAPRDDLEAYK